jgi:PAS domain S-box-containing protein
VTPLGPPSNESFRLLFAGSPLPMWLYDLETLAFLEVNDAAVASDGYSREELLRMRISDIRPDEEVEALLADVRGPRPVRQFSGGWRHRLRDGRLIDVEIASQTFEFRGRPAALVVVHDVTARKEAERALTRSEARKAAILESALDCIITMDADGRVIEFNPAAERTFGYRQRDVVGQFLADLIIPPDLRDAHRVGLARHRETGQHKVLGQRIEMRALRADGEEFPVELTIAPIQADAGQVLYIGVCSGYQRPQAGRRGSAPAECGTGRTCPATDGPTAGGRRRVGSVQLLGVTRFACAAQNH